MFPEVAEGSYAIAVFQDLNGNNSLDRDPKGLPQEPYGFSNGTGRTAPPSFEAARITVTGPTPHGSASQSRLWHANPAPKKDAREFVRRFRVTK